MPSIVAMGIIFAAILGVAFWGWSAPGRTEKAASLATSFGILGTFVGISFALYNFDISNIDQGITGLLEGMKTAFFTSVVGIFSSILLRIFTRSKGKSGQTVDDLAALLEKQNELLDTMCHSLAGTGDSTLLSQVRLLRQDNSDNLNGLRQDFASFSKTMADNNSKALIEALKEVIRDFNSKINEQFGENFKQLNVAVGRMLTWQQQYKAQIAHNVKAFESVASGIEAIEGSLRRVVASTDSITQATERLDTLMQRYDTSQTDLEHRLSAFKSLAEQAQLALPIIKSNLDEMTVGLNAQVTKVISETQRASTRLSEANQQAYTELTKSLVAQSTAATSLERASTEIHTNTSRASKELTRTTQRAVAAMGQAVEKSLEGTRQEMSTMLRGMNQDMSTLSGESRVLIQKQIAELDRALEEELRKALLSLGTQLAALSKRFVDDYTPLTRELQRVVEISKRIPR